MGDEQEIRKRKLAELRARREQSKRANEALVDQREAREQKPMKGGLPRPDEEYAASVFGQTGDVGDSMSSTGRAAPLVVGWGTGDAQKAGSHPSGPRETSTAAGQAKHQPQATSPGPSTWPGPGPPSLRPPYPAPLSANHRYDPAPFGASPHGPPSGPWHPQPPHPPPVPPSPGQPMEHFLPGDPRGGHPPPPHNAFVPLAVPQGGFHGMVGGGVPGIHDGGGVAPGHRGPRGQSRYFQTQPQHRGLGPPRGNPGIRGGGDMRGMGARYGRQRGGGGGRRGGRQGGRGGYRGHNDNGAGSGGYFKASFVEDPWKELLSK